jgi:hypothetical protein
MWAITFQLAPSPSRKRGPALVDADPPAGTLARSPKKKHPAVYILGLIETMNPDWCDMHSGIDVTVTLIEAEAGPPLSSV